LGDLAAAFLSPLIFLSVIALFFFGFLFEVSQFRFHDLFLFQFSFQLFEFAFFLFVILEFLYLIRTL